MFLSPPLTVTTSWARRLTYYAAVGLCTCYCETGLLQFTASRTIYVYIGNFEACSLCCSSPDRWPGALWSRDWAWKMKCLKCSLKWNAWNAAWNTCTGYELLTGLNLINAFLCKDVLVAIVVLLGHTRLRSATLRQYDDLFTRMQFVCWAFSVGAPMKWNNLPAELRFIADTRSVKKALKTTFFRLAYS